MRHDKNCNKDVHWLGMWGEHELSAVALQPSMDGGGVRDECGVCREGVSFPT